MIFEGDAVTKLVVEWQDSQDKTVMNDILLQSTCLVEVIVSKYDPSYREDLIQESLLRLQYACSFFDPKISTLHNFFTTVIHNICNTFVMKQEREYLYNDNVDDDDDRDELTDDIVDYTTQINISQSEQSTMSITDLIYYMRKRFPSIPATILDESAEIMFYGLRNTEGYKNILQDITQLTLSRSMATLIYNVGVVYMRWQNLSNAIVNEDGTDELSLLQELRMVVGSSTYHRLLVTFAGMTVRFPQ